MRNLTVLKEGWRFGKSRGAALEPVTLPHTWNAADGQDGGNDYHRGVCWYVRELHAEETAGERVFLEVNGEAVPSRRRLLHLPGGADREGEGSQSPRDFRQQRG